MRVVIYLSFNQIRLAIEIDLPAPSYAEDFELFSFCSF